MQKFTKNDPLSYPNKNNWIVQFAIKLLSPANLQQNSSELELTIHIMYTIKISKRWIILMSNYFMKK